MSAHVKNAASHHSQFRFCIVLCMPFKSGPSTNPTEPSMKFLQQAQNCHPTAHFECLCPFILYLLQGTMPKVQTALELYNILSESDTNLRQPVRLESQLLQDKRLDSEVGKSMLQLLQVCLLICLMMLSLVYRQVCRWYRANVHAHQQSSCSG